VTGRGAIEFELVEGTEAFLRLQEPWESLERCSATQIFQTHAYGRLWMDTVGAASGATPLIVIGREGNRVVGLFPACRTRESRGVPALAWLGGPRALDYGDILFDEGGTTGCVDDFVGGALDLLERNARGTLLLLTNVREDAAAYGALSARLRVTKQSSAPFVPITGTYEEYLATRGRSLGYNLRRKWRRLERDGEARLEFLEPGSPDIEPTLERLVEFVRARHNAVGRRSDLFDEGYVRLRHAFATAHPAGRVSRIVLDGVVIGACLHALYCNRLHCLVLGHDDEYGTYSPGQQLHGHAVRTCFERGLDTYDLGWGDEPYKYEWTDSETRLTSFVSDNAKGALYAAALAAGRRVMGARTRGGNREAGDARTRHSASE